MATELPRPGTEVIQEFQSVSPTIVTPTLVPCVVAPFFEVIEVLNDDGTVTVNPLNDYYIKIIRLASDLAGIQSGPVFNVLSYRMDVLVRELYDYIASKISKKQDFSRN